MRCEECDGTRHVRRGGAWVPCRCLVDQRWRDRCVRAGIPAGYLDTPSRELLRGISPSAKKRFAQLAKAIRSDKTPSGSLFVHGTRGAYRFSMGLLREVSRGGGACRVYSVIQLVDRLFERPRTEEPFEIPVAVLRLGLEPNHKWNQKVVEEFAAERSIRGGWTIYTATAPPESLRREYGNRVAGIWGEGELVAL